MPRNNAKTEFPAPARDLDSIAFTAERHGVCSATIRRWGADGWFPLYRVGPRLLRVDRAEVDAALLGNPVPTAEPTA